MPLSPDFSIAISSNRETLTITDETVYGGSNPARADLNVSIVLSKVDIENVATEITVTGNDEDPSTDTSWTAAYDVDGHYKIEYTATDESDEEVATFTYRRVLTAHSQWRFAQMVSEQSHNTDYDDGSTLQDIIEFDNLLTAALIADTRTEVADGETICRKIKQRYIDGAN